MCSLNSVDFCLDSGVHFRTLLMSNLFRKIIAKTKDRSLWPALKAKFRNRAVSEQIGRWNLESEDDCIRSLAARLPALLSAEKRTVLVVGEMGQSAEKLQSIIQSLDAISELY